MGDIKQGLLDDKGDEVTLHEFVRHFKYAGVFLAVVLFIIVACIVALQQVSAKETWALIPGGDWFAVFLEVSFLTLVWVRKDVLAYVLSGLPMCMSPIIGFGLVIFSVDADIDVMSSSVASYQEKIVLVKDRMKWADADILKLKLETSYNLKDYNWNRNRATQLRKKLKQNDERVIAQESDAKEALERLEIAEDKLDRVRVALVMMRSELSDLKVLRKEVSVEIDKATVSYISYVKFVLLLFLTLAFFVSQKYLLVAIRGIVVSKIKLRIECIKEEETKVGEALDAELKVVDNALALEKEAISVRVKAQEEKDKEDAHRRKMELKEADVALALEKEAISVRVKAQEEKDKEDAHRRKMELLTEKKSAILEEKQAHIEVEELKLKNTVEVESLRATPKRKYSPQAHSQEADVYAEEERTWLGKEDQRAAWFVETYISSKGISKSKFAELVSSEMNCVVRSQEIGYLVSRKALKRKLNLAQMAAVRSFLGRHRDEFGVYM